MRVLMVIFGVLLLPGLCFLGFGLTWFRGTLFGIIELVIGAGLSWGAFALITSGGR